MGDSGGKSRYCVPPSSPTMSEPDSSTDEDRSDISDLPLRTGKIGIANPSNICYTNATLQAFASVPEIYSQLINFKGTFSEENKDKQDFLTALGDLLKVLHNYTNETCTSTDRFRNQFLIQLKKYGSPSNKANFTTIYTQNDVVEFVGLLLDFIMIAQLSDKKNLKNLNPDNGKVQDWIKFVFPSQKDISKNDPDALNQLTKLKNFTQKKLSKTIYDKIGFFELLENEYDQTKKTLDTTEKREGKKPEDFLGKKHFLKLSLEEFFLARIEHNGETKNLKQRLDDHFTKKKEDRNTPMNEFKYVFQKRWLFTLPDVFFVQIARYSGTGWKDSFEASYDKQPVEYDPKGTIDLIDYVYPDRRKHYENNSTYSVSAIIWYTGNHYICISKLQDGWFKFDDGAKVEKFFFDEDNLAELYMRTFCIFYRKTSSPEITVVGESDDESDDERDDKPLLASPSPPPKPEGTLNPQRTLLNTLLQERQQLFTSMVDPSFSLSSEFIENGLEATKDQKSLSGEHLRLGIDQLLLNFQKNNEKLYDVQAHYLELPNVGLGEFSKSDSENYNRLKEIWGDPQKPYREAFQKGSKTVYNFVGGKNFDKGQRLNQYFKGREQKHGLTFFYFEIGGHWYMVYVKHEKNPIELHYYDSLNFFGKLNGFRDAIKKWIKDFYKTKSVNEIIDTVSSSEKQKDNTSCGPFIVNKMKCEIEAYIRNLTSSFVDRAAKLAKHPISPKKRENSPPKRQAKKPKTLEDQKQVAQKRRQNIFDSQKSASGIPKEDTSGDRDFAVRLQEKLNQGATVISKVSSFSQRSSSQPKQSSSEESSDSASSSTETSGNPITEFFGELKKIIKKNQLQKSPKSPVLAENVWNAAKKQFGILKEKLTIDQKNTLKTALVKFFKQEEKNKNIQWGSINNQKKKMEQIKTF